MADAVGLMQQKHRRRLMNAFAQVQRLARVGATVPRRRGVESRATDGREYEVSCTMSGVATWLESDIQSSF